MKLSGSKVHHLDGPSYPNEVPRTELAVDTRHSTLDIRHSTPKGDKPSKVNILGSQGVPTPPCTFPGQKLITALHAVTYINRDYLIRRSVGAQDIFLPIRRKIKKKKKIHKYRLLV